MINLILIFVCYFFNLRHYIQALLKGLCLFTYNYWLHDFLTYFQKEDDLVFETFYHRSGKEFQCIYQSGMRFYLDDWGSKVNRATMWYFINVKTIAGLSQMNLLCDMHSLRSSNWIWTFVCYENGLYKLLNKTIVWLLANLIKCYFNKSTFI